jgi:GH15 family glucan-1,4-alpha-glucosidase
MARWIDSPACLAALLGNAENGRWLTAPIDTAASAKRRYLGDTLILETTFKTTTGTVCVVDFLSRCGAVSDVVRLVRGVSGSVAMRIELIVRFDYGLAVPWVTQRDDGRLQMVVGADRLLLDTKVLLRGEDMRTVGEFEIAVGREVGFVLTWTPSYKADPERVSATNALNEVHSFWSDWAATFKPAGEWPAAVLRSLLTL